MILEGQETDSFMFQMPNTFIIVVGLRKALAKYHWLAQNLCRPSGPQTCSDPPVPGCCVLESQVQATMPGLADAFGSLPR